jgi:Flp pilus assembly protein TadD
MKQFVRVFWERWVRNNLSRSTAITAVFIAVVAFMVNVHALSGGFVYDDRDNVLRNPWIAEPGKLLEAFTHHMAAFSYRYDTSYYRPMMHAILAGAREIFGPSPWGFHLVVILLHSIASAVVFAILLRLLPVRRSDPSAQSDKSAALAGALLFAVHSIHAEAVAWISGVVEVSYSLFFLGALLSTTSKSPSVRLALAPTLFFLSLLSKEPAVMLLPVLVALFIAKGDFRETTRRRQDMVTIGIFLSVLAVYLLLRVNALGGLMGTGGAHRVHIGFGDGVFTALALFGEYTRLVLFPWKLTAVHNFGIASSLSDFRVWIGLAVGAAICASVWRFRQNPDFILGAALYVFPLMPALYVPVLGEGLLAERYLYLPSAGMAILAATAWYAMSGYTRMTRIGCALVATAVIIVCAAATITRNRVWHDDLSLWTDAAQKSSDSAVAHEYLGFALYESGQFASAVTSLSRSLEIDPNRTDARINLAAALSAMGRTGEAIAQARRVLSEHPKNPEIHGVLAFALAAQGRLNEAEAECRIALAIDPNLASVHNQLGIILAQQGHIAGAISEFREAVRLNPKNRFYKKNLSLLTQP